MGRKKGFKLSDVKPDEDAAKINEMLADAKEPDPFGGDTHVPRDDDPDEEELIDNTSLPDRRRSGPKGRSKLTDAALELFLEAKRKGASDAGACAYANINPHTLTSFLQRGKRKENPDPEARMFLLRIYKAEKGREVELLDDLNAAAKEDPKFALELLARLYPERYGKREPQKQVPTEQKKFVMQFQEVEVVDGKIVPKKKDEPNG